MVNSCQCSCHNGAFYACDHIGGCGCGIRRRTGCVVCPVVRPDADPRDPHNPPVCDGDRRLLDTILGDITILHDELVNPEAPIIDNRQYERYGTAYFKGGHRHTFSRGLRPADPLAALGGVAPINSKRKAPSVSGSREAPMPISADQHDLKAAARVPNPTAAARRHPEDQIGVSSTATVLDSWVRVFREDLWREQHLPPGTVDLLATWLRVRLDDICDHHPAVDEFAGEIKAQRGRLRAATGQVEPQPERCDGIACKRCDQATLYRQPDGDVHCVNADCRAVYRPDEYQDWLQTLAAEHGIKRRSRQHA